MYLDNINWSHALKKTFGNKLNSPSRILPNTKRNSLVSLFSVITDQVLFVFPLTTDSEIKNILNLGPLTLCCAVCSYVCKLCTYCKHVTVIQAVRYTLIFIFPRAALTQPTINGVAIAIENLDAHALNNWRCSVDEKQVHCKDCTYTRVEKQKTANVRP